MSNTDIRNLLPPPLAACTGRMVASCSCRQAPLKNFFRVALHILDLVNVLMRPLARLR